MDATEKKIREEQAEKKMQEATEKAYNKSITYPESMPPARSKSGTDKGEMGMAWDKLFKKN